MYSFKKHFDLRIIDDFRYNIINNSNDFTFQYYQNRNAKNIWSKICSCTDWIQASAYNLQKDIYFDKDINVSLEFLHLIITIDSLSEGVKQMWISFGEKSPLRKNKNIFNGHIFGEEKTDDQYFKHIRSFFGVHAVNGNKTNVKLKSGKEIKNVRFFSSWVHKWGDDFCTRLYSNNKKAEKDYGGQLSVNINALVKYAKERYLSLKDLRKKIQSKYKNIQYQLINDIKEINNSNNSAFNKIVQLRKYAKNNYKGNILSDEIDLYIRFHKMNLNSFSKIDKLLIQKYLTSLNKEMLSIYFNALCNKNNEGKLNLFFPEDNNDWYLDDNYDFAHIVDNENIVSKESSLNILIKKKKLPAYVRNLNDDEIKLLIKAKAYTKPNHLKNRKIENNRGNTFLNALMKSINDKYSSK